MRNVKTLIRQLAAFLGVGAIATCVDYLTFLCLYRLIEIDSVVAALIGYGIGGAISYSLTRRFVFESQRSHQDALWRFFSIVSIGFILTWLSMSTLVTHIDMNASLARIITYCVVLTFNFLAHRFFTFRR